MPPDFPPPLPPPPPPPLLPPPPPEVGEQDDCMAAELLLLPPAPSVSLSLALSAMAAAGWGKEEQGDRDDDCGGGGGSGEGWAANEWARGEHRGAPSWAPGTRAQTRSAAREREGASRCQGTSSAREQRPRPGSGSIALRLAPAGLARLVGHRAKLSESSGTVRPPPRARLLASASGPGTRSRCEKSRLTSAPAARWPHVF